MPVAVAAATSRCRPRRGRRRHDDDHQHHDVDDAHDDLNNDHHNDDDHDHHDYHDVTVVDSRDDGDDHHDHTADDDERDVAGESYTTLVVPPTTTTPPPAAAERAAPANLRLPHVRQLPPPGDAVPRRRPRCTSPPVPVRTIVAGTRSTPALVGADVGTRYYVRASASNAAGWSPTSTTLVVPGVLRPAAPANLRAPAAPTTLLRSPGTPSPACSPTRCTSPHVGRRSGFTVAGTRSTPAVNGRQPGRRHRYYVRLRQQCRRLVAGRRVPRLSCRSVPPPAAPGACRWADNIR